DVWMGRGGRLQRRCERRPARRRRRTGRPGERGHAGLSQGGASSDAAGGTEGHGITRRSAGGAEEPARRACERGAHRRPDNPVTTKACAPELMLPIAHDGCMLVRCAVKPNEIIIMRSRSYSFGVSKLTVIFGDLTTSTAQALVSSDDA